jgi:hypothetical protein
MAVSSSLNGKPSPWQISLGAVGMASSQFARCGFDVSVLSGPNKPWYDLLVARGENLLKVVVKGSEDGAWGLIESYLKRASDMSGKKADYQGAIDLWLDHHGTRTAICLVQFEGVSVQQLPRIYLASPDELAPFLRESVDRLASPILHEKYVWGSVADGAAAVETLPSAWLFAESRVQELLQDRLAKAQPARVLPRKYRTAAIWPASAVVPRISYAKEAAA